MLIVIHDCTSPIIFYGSELANERVGVDSYVWLHRGAYACAAELCQGKPTRKYVDYFLYRVQLLLQHDIKVLLVFDGAPLPAKRKTEEERKARRVRR